MTESRQSPPPVGRGVEPVDPDTADRPWHASPRRRERLELAQILAVISSGGVLGSCARYGAGLRWPTATGHVPWTTFAVNVVGCALMGVLMVLVTERFTAHPLVRPFLGTGVLGGFTTFSTYAIDAQHLLQLRLAAPALAYLGATLLATVVAVWLGATATRLVVFGRRWRP